MFDRPQQQGERTLLLHIEFKTTQIEDEDIYEFKELATSAGAEIIDILTYVRPTAEAKLLIGKGKAEEIAEQVKIQNIDVVIINHTLTPGQERNLEKLFQCRVLDRTGLVLDIFAQRAHTFEGKLQVELAQLQHLSTRLIRGWTHLERQKGGIGLRGPGETQLETDRRLIQRRMYNIKKRLAGVEKRRALSRQSRKKASVPTVALVGYTNAGKSTLFNQLTENNVYVADQLFATLDPTLRKINLPVLGNCVIADTVGFIRHLPHSLVAAFKATLEETKQADLLVHIIDASDPNYVDKIADVETVLEQIKGHLVPRLQVYNKIDLLEDAEPKIQRDGSGTLRKVMLSAQTTEGIEMLKCALVELLSQDRVVTTLTLPAEISGAIRAQLFAQGTIINEDTNEFGEAILSINVPKKTLEQMFKAKALKWQDFTEKANSS